MDNLPLLSIICTVYNQEAFIKDCLEAVAALDYPNVELFVVDNGSEDNAKEIIKEWLSNQNIDFQVSTIFRESRWPYCKSFNEVFSLTSGKYLIDLSGDDLLLTAHAMKSVQALENHPTAAVCFSDALLEKNGKKSSFYPRTAEGKLKKKVEDGDLYKKLVASHHVLSVTMVLRSDALRAIGGYDETLSYEDFDIQVRLARKYSFVFSDHFGLIKTLHPNAFSATQYMRYRSVMLPSTLRICWKIKEMNQDSLEDKALLQRVLYELKHSLLSANFEQAIGFMELASALGASGLHYFIYGQWIKYRWDFSALYVLLKKIKG
ncbi:glycosyltransferase family 2 protein [Cecembia lonarensis]|uniref:Spore coat polysaccharide biosynthesis protein spsA n=1 Tax=Cecembia lonarensis (strain CCUG 58316 / KCTC 22772 / LW9) TaxID=1225176 RepID=K1LBA8_CECL9|nr:glycosyltransferase [Cecembia lonarensis]EKB49547.1 Spore coat polysaccharide biosynthesis protein spsA [Cecembia lonarensis LW9]